MAITLDGTNGVTTPDLTVDTDTLKVDATNNRIGIGNTSPDRTVSIKHASQAEVGFKTGSVSNGALIYYNDSENKLLLRAQESGERIEFQTGGTTARASITDNGICFGTDTAAANALDDYEEGTWTPAVSTASTHHSRVGLYTKIGNMVHIQCSIHFTQSGTTFGSISGLPFVVAGVNYSPLTFREWYSTGITMSGNLTIGSQSTTGFWNYVNNSAAVNGQQYGYALSTTYRT